MIFIMAGMSLVLVIVAATLVYEQPDTVTVPNDESAPVVTPPAEEEPEEEVPVIEPEQITHVKVYFGNDREDPDAESCEEVYPVERDIEPTLAVAKESLDQLLAGVTRDEAADGYFSNIHVDARVVSVAVEQGTAVVVFSEDFQRGMSGSCKVLAARAQIEETLKQFANIQEVVIQVEGVPDEEVLQP